ncbi:MAG TPA: hypothetical protein VJU84_02910 [Pyrinomonadaceae bacterium]|nr:hypothetical protein [Pyrinomonadaceae bacterium]
MSDKLRLKLGKTYLKLVNRLPQFRGGFVRALQDIADHHKKQAHDTYKSSRPPKDVTLEFLYFRSTEVFNLEDFDQLQRGLFRLFPDLKNEFFYRFAGKEFTKQTESMHGSGSGILGYVLRDKTMRWFGMDVKREIPTLPPEVDFVEVWYHKILPSVILITLDVHLTEEANRSLMSVQERHYEPAIRFTNIVPWLAPRRSYSVSHSESEMRNAVLGWLEALRGRVEDCFRPFLAGYFTKQAVDEVVRLPTVEVYALKGAPEEIQAFGEWARTSSRQWLDSLGFSFFLDVYTDEDSVFTIPDRFVTKQSSAYRLVVLWDRYVQSVGTDMHGGNEKRAIKYNTRYALDAFSRLIALHELLNSIQRTVARLRRVAFRSMHRTRGLGQFMRLSKVILRESILLDRIPMEFKQNKRLIEYAARAIDGFKEVRPDFGKVEEETFPANVIAGLEERMQSLKEQVEHIKQTFSDFLVLKNMRSLYILQWIVLILSIIAILTNWPNIKQFLIDIRELLLLT